VKKVEDDTSAAHGPEDGPMPDTSMGQAQQADDKAEQEHRVIDRRSQLRKPVIVLIHEDPDTGEWFAVALEKRGFHVLTVLDRAEGMALVEARQPDAVVSNLALPQIGGWDLREPARSRSSGKRRRLVLFEEPARIDEATPPHAAAHGVRLVPKRCDPSTLADVLDELLT
jgi:CheY-like chemotaxis protein